jgi:hypothetical protein
LAAKRNFLASGDKTLAAPGGIPSGQLTMVLADDQALASSVAADKSSSSLRQYLVKRAILKRLG